MPTQIEVPNPLPGKMLHKKWLWDASFHLPHVLPCKQLPMLLVHKNINRLAHTHRLHRCYLYTGTQEHQPACASTRTPSLFVHRNINHEKLDAFMCNECGHSRFGKFELSMSMSPCVSYPPLQTQDDMLRALACLEHNVSTAHARHTSLATSVK